MTMRILLFDVDSVMIEPHGYHRALSETVGIVGDLCGIADAALSEDQINAFEAVGVSSEWDSSAMCLIQMAKTIWRVDPGFSLPDRLDAPAPVRPGLRLDISGMIAGMRKSALSGRPVGQRAEEVLLDEEELTAEQRGLVSRWMRQARTPDSLPFLIFQELITGSDYFTQSTGLKPRTHTESYLTLYDLPLIFTSDATALRKWSDKDGHATAMLTARPGLADGLPWMTPDAEMGAELIGLREMPLASVGKLVMLAGPTGKSEQELVKPSPLHALLALLLAVHTPEERIVAAVGDFLAGHGGNPDLRQFAGARITVFEDALNGILSLRACCDRLAELGIETTPEYIGVTDLAVKRQVLESAGAVVVPDIAPALRLAGL